MNQRNRLALLNAARQNAPNAYVAQEVVIVQHRYLHLQGSVWHGLRSGHMFQNRIQNRGDIFAFFFHFQAGPARAAGSVDNREIQLFVRGAQFHKQVEHFVHHFAGAHVITIHFVNHHNRAQP